MQEKTRDLARVFPHRVGKKKFFSSLNFASYKLDEFPLFFFVFVFRNGLEKFRGISSTLNSLDVIECKNIHSPGNI